MKSDKQFSSFILILLIFVFLFVGGLILLQVGKIISPEKKSETLSKTQIITPIPPSPTQKIFGKSEFTCIVNEPSLKNPIKIFVKDGKMKAEILGADGKLRNVLLNNKDFYVWEKDSHQGVHYIANSIDEKADLSSNPFINQLKVLTEVSESHPDCKKTSVTDSELLVPTSVAFITPASAN